LIRDFERDSPHKSGLRFFDDEAGAEAMRAGLAKMRTVAAKATRILLKEDVSR